MTEKARLGGACTVQGRRDCRLENPPAFIQRSEHEGTSVPELADATLPGKVSKLQVMQSVPETDTGGRGEYPQAFETTRMKELGKIVP